MNPEHILKDIDTIDKELGARMFWDVLWPFLRTSEAPLLLKLTDDGFVIFVGDENRPYATVRMIEKDGNIKCARFSSMPGFLAHIGTIVQLSDYVKATRIYDRVVEHLLAA